jgi:hypothetical protein
LAQVLAQVLWCTETAALMLCWDEKGFVKQCAAASRHLYVLVDVVHALVFGTLLLFHALVFHGLFYASAVPLTHTPAARSCYAIIHALAVPCSCRTMLHALVLHPVPLSITLCPFIS